MRNGEKFFFPLLLLSMLWSVFFAHGPYTVIPHTCKFRLEPVPMCVGISRRLGIQMSQKEGKKLVSVDHSIVVNTISSCCSAERCWALVGGFVLPAYALIFISLLSACNMHAHQTRTMPNLLCIWCRCLNCSWAHARSYLHARTHSEDHTVASI